jgi:uncharacterized damage-inducible protein DinB
MSVSESVRQAWGNNLRVNQVVLSHLTPEMLGARTPGGGMSVAQHLAHIVGTVKYWGTQFGPDMLALPRLFTVREDLDESDPEAYVPETDLERIAGVMEETYRAALKVAEAATGKGATEYGEAHDSPDAYLIHMLAHDAHHRGQLLLALKTAGFALPDEDAVWGPWRGG